jgi:hypothetical protein
MTNTQSKIESRHGEGGVRRRKRSEMKKGGTNLFVA